MDWRTDPKPYPPVLEALTALALSVSAVLNFLSPNIGPTGTTEKYHRGGGLVR